MLQRSVVSRAHELHLDEGSANSYRGVPDVGGHYRPPGQVPQRGGEQQRVLVCTLKCLFCTSVVVVAQDNVCQSVPCFVLP